MAKEKKEREYVKRRHFIRLAIKDDRSFIRKLSSEAFSMFGDYGKIIPQGFLNPDVITVIYVNNGNPLSFAMLSVPSEASPQTDKL